MVEAGTSNNAIEISMRRQLRDGIKVSVKVWPEVEAFFERWSGGSKERPSHGRQWKPLGEAPLTLWSLGQENMGPSTARPYSLVHSGLGFTVGPSDHPNISFLRLVGISAPEGVDLVVETLIARGEIFSVAQRLSEACNAFYADYLQSVNVRAVVTVFSLPSAA